MRGVPQSKAGGAPSPCDPNQSVTSTKPTSSTGSSMKRKTDFVTMDRARPCSVVVTGQNASRRSQDVRTRDCGMGVRVQEVADVLSDEVIVGMSEHRGKRR